MNTAFVKIWDTVAGAVAWDEESGYASFEYDPGFKTMGWELAPLQMPLTSPNTIFSFPAFRKKSPPELDTFKGLPGLLSDSLPDRFGTDVINAWLALQGREENSLNPVEMLCFIGTRGMGALEFEPAILKETKRAAAVEIDTLVYTARALLSRKNDFSTNLLTDEEAAIKDILRIGTSAGGARPKAVIAYNPKTGEVKSGQTAAPRGFEHWLIKLDGVSDVQLGSSTGYGRVEMAYHTMAAACGIEMTECRLLEENGRAHFMTRRFDRGSGSSKHHIQTFCAIKHFDFNNITAYSYEQLFQTMRELRLSYADAEQMFRRMVFNVAARNCDDHTKNFSFILKKDAGWALAPAYDICHAYQPKHKWVSSHALSINGKRDGITKEDLLKAASLIKLKKADSIINQISSAVTRWPEFAEETGVAPLLRDEISKTLVKL